MATVKATVGFGDASYYERLHVRVDADEVQPEWVPAKYETVKVLADDGTVAQDPETGAELTREEVVSPGRYESKEEALAKYLVKVIDVDDIEQEGITSLTFEVQYTIQGSVQVELTSYELADLGIEDVDPDEVDEYYIEANLDEYIREAIDDDQRYNAETEFFVGDVEAS